MKKYLTLRNLNNVLFIMLIGFIISCGQRLGEWLIPQPKVQVEVNCKDVIDRVPDGDAEEPPL